jgi:hypothetical protein
MRNLFCRYRYRKQSKAEGEVFFAKIVLSSVRMAALAASVLQSRMSRLNNQGQERQNEIHDDVL